MKCGISLAFNFHSDSDITWLCWFFEQDGSSFSLCSSPFPQTTNPPCSTKMTMECTRVAPGPPRDNDTASHENVEDARSREIIQPKITIWNRSCWWTTRLDQHLGICMYQTLRLININHMKGVLLGLETSDSAEWLLTTKKFLIRNSIKVTPFLSSEVKATLVPDFL